MTEINTREIMVECLTEILERGAYSHLVLQKVLTKYQYLEKRQRAFLTRTVQGTLERKIELDGDIKAFGTYRCEVKLYTGISAKVYVVVTEA